MEIFYFNKIMIAVEMALSLLPQHGGLEGRSAHESRFFSSHALVMN